MDHLSFLLSLLGDISQDVHKSAADSTLETLKNDALKDFDKKTEIQETLSISKMSSEDFNSLVNLGKKITDYKVQDQGELNDGDRALNDDYGVAVVFDEEDQDDSSNEDDEDAYEVYDQTTGALPAAEEEAEVLGDTQMSGALKTQQEEMTASREKEDMEDQEDDFTTVVKTAPSSKDKSGQDSSFVQPAQVDAFWLQRKMASYYSDAHTAQAKTMEAMEILSSPSKSPRDVENDLMALFDYDHFDLVKLLTRNRDTIVWCTRLSQAPSNAERDLLVKEMESQGLHEILEALPLAKKSKRTTTQGGDAMDIDASKAQEPEKVDKAGLSLVPKAQIDLDSLVFAQGSHTMTNKKVKLPEGSFKKTKTGYEEIHVPAPSAKPFSESETLVPITSLPEWAQDAFKGAKQLNRVQSRVYPFAFANEGNMLLCAPTGAGK